MQYEKTAYVFQINDTQAAYQMIMDFLNTYKFKFVDKNGMPHYEYNDYVTAKRFFEFYFQGNQLTIYAYLRSMKKPMPIDRGAMAAAVKNAYRSQLDPLLEGLTRLMMSANQMTDPMQGMTYSQSIVNSTQASCQKNAAGNTDSMAITSFILAIIGAVLCGFGFMYGAVILFVQVWSAIVGMKSKLWPLSVASIILCIGTVIYCVLVYL